MDVNLLVQWASAGMTPEETAVLAKAFGRDDVKSRVAALKAQDEYAAIEAERIRLQLELEGDDTRLGAKAYQKWVADNDANIKALQAREAAYRLKYGDLEGGAPPPNTGSRMMTEEDIKREAGKYFQESIAPNLSRTFTTANKLVQTHIMAGRKTMLDLDELGKTATSKFGGDLERAYEEWDRPERERIAKEQQDAEVTRRVNEEIQKRGGSMNFPPTSDTGPSTLVARPKADVDKFDRNALANELVGTWNQAGTGRTQ